ncbi:group II intron maturase-specific domain-containing protein [Paenibacillus ehimensis]|uniref:group II intron maturase-specific domain-containing protein n=1 Tax=Paenibacillus ehimensis TaxID=79264 RepID=UPI0034E2C978
MLLFWPVKEAIQILNAKIRGFAEYFRRGNSKEVFRDIDQFLWWLVLHRLTQRTRRYRQYVAQKHLFRYNTRTLTTHNTANMPPGTSDSKTKKPATCIYWINSVLQDSNIPTSADRDKKLNELLKIHRKRFLQRLFGRDNWFSFRTDVVKRQNSRCAGCKRKLTQGYTHVYFREASSHLEQFGKR